MSAGKLGGRLALITGAGSGIGRAVCQLFAKEGARIAAVDLNEDGLAETIASLAGEGHSSYCCDVASLTAVSDLFTKVKVKCEGHVPCVIVCCAGIWWQKAIAEVTDEDYDRMMSVNMKGTFLVMQNAAKNIEQSEIRNASVVTISSMATKDHIEGHGVYAASKAGVIAITKVAAKEWAHIPIRCNTILPGVIRTPILRGVTQEAIDGICRSIPLHRLGTPEEVAECCLFLASDSSSYVTGASLEVTGGYYA